MLIDLISFLVVIVAVLAVGIGRSRRVRSENAYLFAERQTAWLALTATLVMTEFNSATLISFSSLGYAAGLWALVLPFIFLIGLLFYALTVAKKWKAYNGSSVAGFFSEKYGTTLGKMTSILLLLSMIGFSAAYVKSLALLFQPLFPTLSLWVISLSLLTLVLVMSLRGGLVAIIRTDVLSLVLMLFFFPAVAFFMWRSHSLEEASSYTIEQAHTILPFRFVFSLILLTMFTYILAPWYGQKIFAAKSKKVAFWSVMTSAFLVFILYGSAIIATAFYRLRGYEAPSIEHALPCLINGCLPIGFKGFGYALLFATSATTLTGLWSAMSAMFLGDFLKKPISSEQTGCLRSMITTLSFALIAFILANTLVDRVFDKLILANIPIAALSFGLLAGFYWKRVSIVGVWASIVTGIVIGVGAYFIYGDAGCYTWYWAIFGLPLIFCSGFFFSFISKTKSLKYL